MRWEHDPQASVFTAFLSPMFTLLCFLMSSPDVLIRTLGKTKLTVSLGTAYIKCTLYISWKVNNAGASG